MNTETYDQVTRVQADIIGDQAAYLQENMKVKLSVHEACRSRSSCRRG